MQTLPILVSAAVALAATLSAGVFVERVKSHIGIVCAFSSGFFIALALFDLSPEVVALAPEAQIALESLLVTALSGFVFLPVIDRVFLKLHLKGHMADDAVRPRIGLLATAEFCSHAFLEGIAIGVGFQLQFGLGVFVAIAVVSHDFCDGVSTLALMLNSGNSLRSATRMLLVDAVAPVLGAVATLFVAVQEYFLVYALSFLAGSFLYIGAGTLLPDAYRMNRPVVTVAFFLAGFFLLLLFSRLAA